MKAINISNLISVKLTDKFCSNLYRVVDGEIKQLNLDFSRGPITSENKYKQVPEQLKKDLFIEDGKVYLKPTIVFEMVNGSKETALFDSYIDAETAYKKICKTLNLFEI